MSEDNKVKPANEIKEDQSRYLIEERYEIIGGVRYDFLASPKYVHQNLLGQLHLAFHTSCSHDGKILLAPLDVHFDEQNILQPDVIYIANENRGIIRDEYIFGAPDLVVEILSGSTGRRDKTIKKDVYERFGVKGYWLVDPNYRLIDQFAAIEGKYQLIATLSAEDRIHSAVVPCLSIDLADLFTEDDVNEINPTVKEEQGRYLIEERYEIIEGVRYDFLSSPRITHQMILTELYTAIRLTCHTNGIVLVAPMDVHFDEINIMQPDLIYIANESLSIIKDGWVKGVPELLVEILSPSTGSKDKVKKKAVFERFGVPEYWIIDPVYATVDQLVLVDGKYHLLGTFGVEDRLASPNIPCISIDLQQLFHQALRFDDAAEH